MWSSSTPAPDRSGGLRVAGKGFGQFIMESFKGGEISIVQEALGDGEQVDVAAGRVEAAGLRIALIIIAFLLSVTASLVALFAR